MAEPRNCRHRAGSAFPPAPVIPPGRAAEVRRRPGVQATPPPAPLSRVRREPAARSGACPLRGELPGGGGGGGNNPLRRPRLRSPRAGASSARSRRCNLPRGSPPAACPGDLSMLRPSPEAGGPRALLCCLVPPGRGSRGRGRQAAAASRRPLHRRRARTRLGLGSLPAPILPPHSAAPRRPAVQGMLWLESVPSAARRAGGSRRPFHAPARPRCSAPAHRTHSAGLSAPRTPPAEAADVRNVCRGLQEQTKFQTD
ncbi:uncharacterized protein LOC119855094 [Dermochelys coriacea]|uniref:uncharacterized protein LOC119855094 n=1 Tax=Dermochelys coriacea TaxID=27794 RepID=UPI0018E8D543|nr:uncharacterized protein LOC119855094 [Dermochelys coriacea]